jgi:hypothetical protein
VKPAGKNSFFDLSIKYHSLINLITLDFQYRISIGVWVISTLSRRLS